MKMGKYVRILMRKMILLLSCVLLLSVLIFYISRMTPGDPLVSYYGDRVEKMGPEEQAWARARLGLDDSVCIQYIRWLQKAFRGDFGISYKYKMDVTEVIAGRIKNTLLLGGIGFVLTFVLALLLGIVCAWHEDKLIDRIICRVGTVTSCIPEFWLSLLMILIFAVTLHKLPSSGAYTIGREEDLADRVRHLILPLMVVVISHLWYYAYMIRNKLLEEIRADYVLLARMKGLSKRQVMVRHCLRNVLPAYFSLMAISLPHILGGTYIVETVFAYPGIGTLTYESARYKDYNLLMLLGLLTGITVMIGNMIAQAVSERIDPRIRIGIDGQKSYKEVEGL